MMLARQSSSTCEAGYFERLLHMVQQVLLVDRLGEEAERTALRCMHRVRNRAVRRENDHAKPRPTALQFLQQPNAVHLIHAQIRDDEVGPETRASGQRRGRAFNGLDFVVLRAQPDGQQSQQSGVVVDHQNARFALLLSGAFSRAGLQAER